MLFRNTLGPAVTLVGTLILAATVALLSVVAPAPPAQAASGDKLELLSLKAVEITHDEGGFLGDFIDEPYIRVDGVEVWSGRSDPLRMKDGDVRNLTGTSAALSGQSARVQLWESDPGTFNRPDDGPAEFFADYTGGDERTRTLTLNGGVYELTYRVDRPIITPPDTTPPGIGPVKPAPGSSIRDRTPLIQAKVADNLTELGQSNIELTLDQRPRSFAYDADTDRLLYQSGRLAYGKHSVEVSATDSANQTGSRIWTFKVVRR